MTDADSSTIALAVRRVRSRPDAPERGVLLRSIEHALFVHRAIGPVDPIAVRALDDVVAAEEWARLSDEALCDTWERAVRSAILDFMQTPESWTGAGVDEFIEACGFCFGVDDAMVPRLLRNFADLPPTARLAIFLLLERSASFAYLKREIDGITSVPEVDDPRESFQRLLKRTFDGP